MSWVLLICHLWDRRKLMMFVNIGREPRDMATFAPSISGWREWGKEGPWRFGFCLQLNINTLEVSRCTLNWILLVTTGWNFWKSRTCPLCILLSYSECWMLNFWGYLLCRRGHWLRKIKILQVHMRMCGKIWKKPERELLNFLNSVKPCLWMEMVSLALLLLTSHQ